MNAQPPAADLAGDWLGTLGSGAEKLRLKLHVVKTYDGLYIGKLLSIAQGDGQFRLAGSSLRAVPSRWNYQLSLGVLRAS